MQLLCLLTLPHPLATHLPRPPSYPPTPMHLWVSFQGGPLVHVQVSWELAGGGSRSWSVASGLCCRGSASLAVEDFPQ